MWQVCYAYGRVCEFVQALSLRSLAACWDPALSPVLPPAPRFFKQFAPGHENCAIAFRPGGPWVPPDWLAPDGELRRQFDQRRLEEHVDRKAPSERV